MTPSDYTIDIVSPQYPCGAAWLANALLELKVPLWHLWGFDTRQEWDVDVDGAHHYAARHLPWQQTLASLRLGRIFRFVDGIQPRFSHAFPWQLALCSRIVLVVRDPRDALYSEWQRHRRNLRLPESVPFTEFLRQPFCDGPISTVDMLWLHLRSWLALRQSWPERIYLLRFEDWKHCPVAALRDVTCWMGMQATEEAITHAAMASDVRHLQAIEQALSQADPTVPQFNRRGLPEEWRSTWQTSWFSALGEHWQPVLSALDYAPLNQPPDAATRDYDLREVLAWRDLIDPVQVQHWSLLLAA